MKAKFHRYGKNLTDVRTDPPTNSQGRSINQAKRESRKLQMSFDGALGRGSVQVDK